MKIFIAPPGKHKIYVHNTLARRLTFLKREIKDIMQQADDSHLMAILQLIDDYRHQLKMSCSNDHGKDKADKVYN